MRRIVWSFAVLAVLGGCTSMEAREARCSCFTSNGNPTGNCDFQMLPQGPGLGGGDLVFKFMDDTLSTRGRTDDPCHD